MTTAKLTLSIPKKLLLEAKNYSRETRLPLSRLVSQYFAVLGQFHTKEKSVESSITAKVSRATGLVKSHQDEGELLFEALNRKYR